VWKGVICVGLADVFMITTQEHTECNIYVDVQAIRLIREGTMMRNGRPSHGHTQWNQKIKEKLNKKRGSHGSFKYDAIGRHRYSRKDNKANEMLEGRRGLSRAQVPSTG